MVKDSDFYLEKQKSFIPKNKIFFKPKTKTDPIFSEGFSSGEQNKKKFYSLKK